MLDLDADDIPDEKMKLLVAREISGDDVPVILGHVPLEIIYTIPIEICRVSAFQ